MTYFEVPAIKCIPFSLVDPEGENSLFAATIAVGVVTAPIAYKLYSGFKDLYNMSKKVSQGRDAINQNINDSGQRQAAYAELTYHAVNEAQGKIHGIANTVTVDLPKVLPNLVSGTGVIDAAKAMLDPNSMLRDAAISITETAPAHKDMDAGSFNLGGFLERVGAQKIETQQVQLN